MTEECRGWRGCWGGEGGMRHLLALSLPLIASTGMMTLQQFVDRIFLAWLSPEAIAAALPAGITSFALLSLFIGTSSYTATFAAQYHGAGRDDRVGPAIWQGVYVALAAWMLQLACFFRADEIFGWLGELTGQAAAVRPEAAAYFRGLCLGGGPAVAASAFAGFFTGLGRPGVVLRVNALTTVVNVAANYVFIFGHCGSPALGSFGAGLGTAVSVLCACGAYLCLMARPEWRGPCRSLAGWRPDGALLKRLLRYGLPAGAHFFLDIAGFACFVHLAGGLGRDAQAATNIAFQLNLLAFMPIVGIGIALAVIVGHAIGAGRPETGARATRHALLLALAYAGIWAALYVLVPGALIRPFTLYGGGAYAAIAALAKNLLLFVAAYCLVDALTIIYTSVLKGAGDTRFVMASIGGCAALVLVLPAALILRLGGGLYAVWAPLPAYVAALALLSWWRYRAGHWRRMRVIEQPAAFEGEGIVPPPPA